MCLTCNFQADFSEKKFNEKLARKKLKVISSQREVKNNTKHSRESDEGKLFAISKFQRTKKNIPRLKD